MGLQPTSLTQNDVGDARSGDHVGLVVHIPTGQTRGEGAPPRPAGPCQF